MTIELDEGALSKRTAPGPSLYYTSAMPTGGAKAVLAVIHGYADHGGRYAHVMGALAEHGIGSVAIDLRGHGRAHGRRGYCTRFEDYLGDARELRQLVNARAKDAPMFLFGHSFGGLVAAMTALEDPSPWRGLVLSQPFFGIGLEVPAIKLIGGKIASRLFPKVGLPSGLRGTDMTHDPVKAKEYDDDPLVFGHANVRWFTETTGAQERLLAEAPRLAMPLYVTFGTADKVSSMPAAKRVFDAAGSADKTWVRREGLLHEVLNEPSWKDIVEDIAKWVLARA